MSGANCGIAPLRLRLKQLEWVGMFQIVLAAPMEP